MMQTLKFCAPCVTVPLRELKQHCKNIHPGQPTECHKTKHQPSSTTVSFKCIGFDCEFTTDNIETFLSHLREHCSIQNIVCPFLKVNNQNCEAVLTSVNSFRIHRERYHSFSEDDPKNILQNQFIVSFSNTAEAPLSFIEISAELNENVTSTTQEKQIDVETFMKSVYKFITKLHAVQLISAATMDDIVAEINYLHTESLRLSLDKFQNVILKRIDCKDINVAEIKKNLLENDPLSKIFGTSGNCRSHYTRMKTLESNGLKKNNLQEELLYKTPKGKSVYNYYYLPSDNILNYFQAPDLRSDILSNIEKIANVNNLYDSETFTDVYDGKSFKSNKFFEKNRDSIAIILFQDAFLGTSPLGSSAKGGSYKFTAIYMTLLQFSPYIRLNENVIQLISMVPQKVIDKVGIQKIYDPIIKDLKNLEEKGFEFDGITYKSGLFLIIGDNLGQNEVGGFLKCFHPNVTYMCRFCQIEGKTIKGNEFHQFKCSNQVWRTPENYNAAAQHLKSSKKLKSFEGVQSDCPFNTLESFHCCLPAMPPCLAHDVFEGTASYDMHLVIKHLSKKYITLEHLNSKIQLLHLKGRDVNNRPNPLSTSKKTIKITGEAVKMWTLIRFFPQIIADEIDFTYPVWTFFLTMKKIITIITLQKIGKKDMTELNRLIEFYYIQREKLFPDAEIKFKHHLSTHYFELIKYFGPLIKVWTLRWESKHQKLKRCFLKKRNFVNPVKTVCENVKIAETYFLSDLTARSEEIIGQQLFSNSCMNPVDLQIHDKLRYKNFSFLSIAKGARVRSILYECQQLLYNSGALYE